MGCSSIDDGEADDVETGDGGDREAGGCAGARSGFFSSLIATFSSGLITPNIVAVLALAVSCVVAGADVRKNSL